MASDELKVRMTLQDEYTAKMKQAHAATAQFGRGVNETHQSLLKLGQGASSGSFSGLGQGISGLSAAFKGLVANANPATLALAAAASVIVGMAIGVGVLVTALVALYSVLLPIFKSAVESALNMERLTMTFVALGNSAAEAKAKMSWLKTFATTSIGEFKDIAEASVQLEAFGLRAEHFIPIISNMAGAFGGTREQILSVAGALGRMTSGTFGEAMEVLKNFGIGKADLIKVGIKITGGGEIKATVEEMLSAIEKIANEKFGGIAAVMGATLGVKLSNLSDAVNQILANLGAGLMPFVKTLVDAVTPVLNFIASEAEAIGNQFNLVFKAMFADAGGAGMIANIGAWILAIMTNIPALTAQVVDALRMTFNNFASGFESFMNLIGSSITMVFNQVSGSIFDAQLQLARLKDWIATIRNPLAGKNSDAENAMGNRPDDKVYKNLSFGQMTSAMANVYSGGVYGDIEKEKDKYLKQFTEFQKKPGGTAGAVSDKYNKNFTAVPDALSVIASNTGDTASNTKALRQAAQDYAFGGGDVGRTNISGVTFKRGGQASVKVKLEGGDDAMTRFFERIINRALLSYQATNGSL